MKYNPDIHKRQSIRLKEYDYSEEGAYFITICTWQRECLFGEITDKGMVSNENGGIVEHEWMRTCNIRSNVKIDKYVIMPNHFHGIIVINANCKGMARHALNNEYASSKRATHRIAPTINNGFRFRHETPCIA